MILFCFDICHFDSLISSKYLNSTSLAYFYLLTHRFDSNLLFLSIFDLNKRIRIDLFDHRI